MYGASARFDPEMFLGREILAITIGINAIHVAFDGGLAITSMNWVEYQVSGEDAPRTDTLPIEESAVSATIGRLVSGAQRTATGGLRLDFVGGGFFHVDDDSPSFESYSITTPDGEVFV